MKIFLSTLFCLIMSLESMAFTPKIIAHRGFWKTDDASQNSLRSLSAAAEAGCHASEFDVWSTADGTLVINHDPMINGINIEKSDYDAIREQLLPNGERIPTLREYLQAAKSLDIRLICELKTHDSRQLERQAVKKILSLIKEYGLEDRTEYITFSTDAFRDLIKLAPKDTDVYYLSGDFIPEQIKEMRGRGIDYYLGTLRKHPEWIERAHSLGLLVNVWTVDRPEDMQWCIVHGIDFITTNEPLLLKEIISRQKD